ncbi:MAG: FAD-dependent monooxygenase [Maritimibacter sp.]|nr:FAD-dependent monooxygenase [Maritimibacter sp.]
MSGQLTKHAKKVLVVGGGVGGPAVAIRMAERGVAVDLVDIEKNWGAAGTGVTLSPLTARALCDLGFADGLMEKGHLHDTLTICDPLGNVVNEVRNPRLYSPDVPAEGGIMRPDLHNLMEDRMRALGVSIRTGTTVTTLDQDDTGVTAAFDDETSGHYDLVIGADGLFSKVRDMVMPDAPKPWYTGQVCWRAQFKRPADWDGARMFFGPIKVGFTPCSPDDMYMFCLENVKEKPFYDDAELLPRLKALLAPFPGLAELRDGMDEDTHILARPLESVLLTETWYQGRVILIGDAAHSTTPHLASGAGMAVEDAIVLVDELDREVDYEAAMKSFIARRLPRGKLVVGNSIRLGEMEQDGSPAGEMQGLMIETLKAICEPY